MPNVTGIVERREGKNVWVNGDRYSTFSESQVHVNPGDSVSFEYTEKHGMSKYGTAVVYRNIKGQLYPADPRGGSSGAITSYAPTAMAPATAKIGVPILDTQRLILRQNALTAAVNYAGGAKTVEEIIEIARQFEQYTSGDGDLKEAEKILDSSE